MRPKHFYTSLQKEFIEEQAAGKWNRELTELFNAEFGTDVPISSIRAFKKNHKIASGLTGQYQKGDTPFNKGKSFPSKGRTSETQFKKGQTPVNFRPVGSERISVDGYIEVKVANPNKWKLKQRVVWEEFNGPVKSTEALVFLDGDRLNCTVDNLYKLTRAELAILNGFDEKPIGDRDAMLALINIVKLKMATYKKGRKLSNLRGETHVSELTEEDYARAKENGIPRTALSARVFKLGWPVERAVTAPLRPQPNRKRKKKGE